MKANVKVAAELVKLAKTLIGKDVDFADIQKRLKAIGFNARIDTINGGPYSGHHLVVTDNENKKLAFSEKSLKEWKTAMDIIRSHSKDNVTYRGQKVLGMDAYDSKPW